MGNGTPGLPALNQIKNLSFQGGGGKGAAYLGVLKWLELNNGPLPAGSKGAGQNISGVSGASAGAITAMCVALGYDAKTLYDQLTQVKQRGTLIDDAKLGDVYSLGQAPPNSLTNIVAPTIAALVSAPELLSFAAILALLSYLGSTFTNNAILKALLSDPEYSASILADGGMFSGRGIRQTLAQLVENSPNFQKGPVLNSPGASTSAYSGLTYSFADLKSTKNIDLVVHATNISVGRPIVFSKKTTPTFPIIEAVAMSASFPLIFKPSCIGSDFAQAQVSGSLASSLQGWYLDGGLTNNIPVHAFDQDPVLDPFGPSSSAKLKQLNTATLGFRLKDGTPDSRAMDYSAPSAVAVLSALYNALNFGANEAQFRTQSEFLQSVLIYSGKGIGLTDFYLGPQQVLQASADLARSQMEKHYNMSAGSSKWETFP